MGNEIVQKSSTSAFIEYNLKQLNVYDSEENSREKNLAKQSLLKVVEYATANNINYRDIQSSSVISAVERVKALGLNLALPNMGYVVIYNGVLSIEPYKNGYIEIFRNYGADVKRLLNVFPIRKGDHFIAPKFVGTKMTDVEYQQNSTYGKVLRMVLQYETEYGEIKYLFAERNNIIPSLIGHIKKIGGRKNGADVDKAVEKIKELDEFDKAYEFVLKNYPHLLSPAWKDFPETMFETKMLNYIVRNHPISDRADTHVLNAIKNAIDVDFVDMEAKDTKVNDRKLDKDINEGVIGSVDVVEKDDPNANTSKDFEVQDEEVEKPKTTVVSERVVVAETGEIIGNETDSKDDTETDTEKEVEVDVRKNATAPSDLFSQPNTKETKPNTNENQQEKSDEDIFAEFLT